LFQFEKLNEINLGIKIDERLINNNIKKIGKEKYYTKIYTGSDHN